MSLGKDLPKIIRILASSFLFKNSLPGVFHVYPPTSGDLALLFHKYISLKQVRDIEQEQMAEDSSSRLISWAVMSIISKKVYGKCFQLILNRSLQ